MQEQNNQIVAAKENFSQAFWVANGVEFLERLAYYADKIRFRSSIILAFSLLTLGYAGLVVLPSLLQGEKFCPYPQSAQFSNSLYFASDYAAATANAHYIWFVFLGVDVVSAISLIIYGKIVNKDG
ncbi:hypothetical protein AwDysgo_19520 [Bacteroidales bacterium]|nr:hypothetical protein AwDysgo_19520 [Bacteroidales bacterium]